MSTNIVSKKKIQKLEYTENYTDKACFKKSAYKQNINVWATKNIQKATKASLKK